MEMKATDLMIGDWVKIKGHLDYDKVQEIAKDENMQWYISFACSATLFRAYEFEPIPLTPEILEKNGWNLDTVLQCYTSTPLWLYGEGIINLLLQFPAKQSAGSLEIFDNQKIRSLFDFTWKDRLYIHELQHTLRLCGLDKLADDFKV